MGPFQVASVVPGLTRGFQEQSQSSQSVKPSPSLSMPSVQSAGPTLISPQGDASFVTSVPSGSRNLIRAGATFSQALSSQSR